MGYVAPTSLFDKRLDVKFARGAYLVDRNNDYYFDGISGIGVSSLGHDNPLVRLAAIEQLECYSHVMVYGEDRLSPQEDYAESLCTTLTMFQSPQIFFLNSGTEATELSLKMSRKTTGREKFVSLVGGFHGRTFGSMSVSQNEKYTSGFGEMLDCVQIVPNVYEGDVYYQEIFSDAAGFILELVQGEAGAIALDQEWVRRVTDIARESGCRIIIDEVQTGFMRTGELWVHETYGIKPDMLNIGKAMGGGLPLSGVVAESSDFSALQTLAFSHVTTFGGNPVCCASGLAAFKQIVGMRQEVRSLSEQFDRWAERVSKLGLLESVSGLG